MIVIYAEKADVGNKIAAALGGFRLPSGKEITFKNRAANEDAIKSFQRKQGFLDITFKGQPCKVTWGYGHLYALQDVPEYNPAYKSWRARPVCFIPDEFKLHPTSSTLANFQKALDKQRKVVKELFKRADYIINATDYDREGELIFSYVCEAIGYHKTFYRVLFTSQTEIGIQDAFNHLIASSDVKNIERAGRARSIYDWIIGTNLSTQMTLRFPKSSVLSIGRVQTPVLKMVVDREEAIRAFVPKTYWNIKGTFHVGKESYIGTYKGTGEMKKSDADAIIHSIAGHPGIVSKLETKRSKKESHLYSQTTLQMDASKLFGYTAKDTLNAAQFLYDNGYASYPRTKSQHLTDDMKKDVVKILKSLSASPRYQKYLDGKALVPADKFFDSAKVISHFAIIPTGDIPTSLSPMQQNIYDLIVWSLIRTIYPDAILEKTSVVTTVDKKYDFSSSGTTIIDEGWMAVHGNNAKETFLPSLSLNASYPGEYEGKETKTEPPKRYDDGSLVAAMKTAGKTLDDPDFRAILADPNVEGIGTDATRADIIETLITRQYMERRGKSFYATDKGINLIHQIPVPDMMSAEFTARMEQSLAKIEDGTLSYEDFIAQIYKQTEEWCNIVAHCKVTAPVSSTSTFGAAPLDEPEPPAPKARSRKTKSASSSASSRAGLICPVCGSNIRGGMKAWNCSNPKCDFHVFKSILSHDVTETEVSDLLQKKETSLISDFVSKKTGKKFTAKLVLNESAQVTFSFEK